MSKLGVGAYGGGGHVLAVIHQVGARVVLLADMALEHAGRTGATLEIGRVSFQHANPDARFADYANDNIGNSTDEAYQRGQEFARRLVAYWPSIKVWALSCEAQRSKTPEDYRILAAFELGGTRILQSLGRQSCVLNLGVGVAQPEEYAEFFSELLNEAGYVGFHAYGSPDNQIMQAGDCLWYALRYRKVRDAMRAAGRRMPPVVLTEATTYDPWRGRYSPGQIATDLLWLGAQMEQDPYVVGCCAFQVGHPSDRWSGFNLDDSAILDVMARWNVAFASGGPWSDAVERPAPAVTPPTPPEEGETLTYTTIGNNYPIVDRRFEVMRRGEYARRDLALVKHIAIHHVGVPGDCTAQQIADYHVLNNGWPGPGYTILIRQSGQAELLNDLDRACYNVAYKNAEVIGVVIAGDFTDEPPSQVQLDSCRRVAAELQYTCGWHVPSAGHRDIADPRSPTRCPGDSWPQWAAAVQVLPPQQSEPVSSLRYVLGFADLAARLGVATVGAPLEPEGRVSLIRQRTEVGVMLYVDGEQPQFYRSV